jgi:hypothetical protein
MREETLGYRELSKCTGSSQIPNLYLSVPPSLLKRSWYFAFLTWKLHRVVNLELHDYLLILIWILKSPKLVAVSDLSFVLDFL